MDRNGFGDRNDRDRNDGRFDGRNGQRPDRDARFDGRNGQFNDRNGRGPDNRGPDNRGPDNRGQGNAGRGGNDRWERNGPPRGRPQVVRPQDRYDRDRSRPRYDRNRWTFLIQPRQHYYWRGSNYYAPYDFYPRSWAYGQTLPWNWYTPDYYIDDWSWYGLPIPPIGCEWVRLGDDAVLVDIFSGRILSVTYSLFY
jgi:Ni/Co efflux regulator RcnB